MNGKIAPKSIVFSAQMVWISAYNWFRQLLKVRVLRQDFATGVGVHQIYESLSFAPDEAGGIVHRTAS
ncbi:MAG TPA: hypothetical protein VEV41_24675 [Terriglobales bacterium]|nr:hypothetical protein [Terriglobales bacterium]